MEDVWIVPKNIRQIGESHGSISVYIEDYAATFISQFAKNIGACAGTGVCYGRIYEETERTNIVIEGIAVNPERVEHVERIFSEEPYREAEKEGMNFFPDQQRIGRLIVDTEAQQVPDSRISQMFTTLGLLGTREEFTLLAGREEGIRGIWVCARGAVEKLENYYIYYDRNETMQSYLIRWNEQLRDAKQEREAQIREQEEVQSIIAEKRKEPFPILECAACLALIAVCVTGIVSINNYQRLQGVEESVQSLARNFYGEEQTDTEAVLSEEAVSEGVPTQLPIYTPQSGQDDNPLPEPTVTEAPDSLPEPTVTEGTEPAVTQTPDSPPDAGADENAMTQTVSYQEYVVKQGDTLSSICYAFYQDRSKVDEVCRLNGITDPDRLAVGQKILLP